MARVIFGQGVAGAKGKVGGSVFQKTRSGYVMKQKGIPTNPKTAYQVGVRSKFTQVSKNWGLLTLAQRKAWNLEADSKAIRSKKKSFGQAFKLSGKALYQEVGQNRLLIGIALPTAVPALGTNIDMEPVKVRIDNTNDKILVDFSASTTEEGFILVSSTGKLSPGISFYKGKYKQIAIKSIAVGSADVDVTAEYKARFGSLPAAGSNVAFLVRYVSSTGYSDATYEPETQYV